jgi:opacity protein-like surface antigen
MKNKTLKTLSYLLAASACLNMGSALAYEVEVEIEEERKERKHKKDYGIDGGLYIGASVGADSINSDTDINAGPLEITGIGPLVTAHAQNDLGDNGFAGTIFAGWEFDFERYKKLYLAVEANATFSTAEAEFNSTVGVPPINLRNLSILNTKVNVENAFGISILPGYKPTKNTLLYARGGVIWGQIETSVVGAVTNEEETHNTFGGQVGLGGEYDITKHLSLRAEYVYSFYQTVEQNFGIDLSIPNAPDPATVISAPLSQSYSVTTGTANIGAVYKF